MNRNTTLFLAVTALTVVEMGFLTFWRKNFDPHTLPFLYLFVQLLIAILPLIFFKKEHVFSANLKQKTTIQIFLSSIIVIGIYVSYSILTLQYKQVALNPAYSDIIPQIQKFCERTLSFKYPYKPFYDFGYWMTPTYLPAQWMPYIPSEWLSFDPRFVTLFIFILAYIYYSILAIKGAKHPVFALILLVIPVLLVSTVNDHDQGIWSVTVEMLIMSYYLVLGLGIAQQNYKLIAFALILCLMSRYSLVFWLPIYFFMLWSEKGMSFIFKLGLCIIAGCLLLYGPFLLKDSNIFFNAQKYYDAASIGEWTREAKPGHLYNGLGFAVYFLERSEDSVAGIIHNIALLKKTMIVSSLCVSAILGYIWWRIKQTMDSTLFAICSLKISLAVFYAFIQIPYSYLYVTPFIISCVILFKVGKMPANQQVL
jgi:hypothetical protein